MHVRCVGYRIWSFHKRNVSTSRPCERACEEYRPHPEERALARVSKDGRESMRCVHPSRRLLRKLLRMRAENILTTSLAGGFCCHAVYRVTIHASIRRSRALMMPTNASLTGVVTPSGLPRRRMEA